MAITITIAAGNSAAQIQAAINGAPAGATVSLAAGSYTFDRTVVIDRDDITVAGAGSSQTIITTARGMGGAPAFQIGDPLFREGMTGGNSMQSAPEGARMITVSSGHAFQPGDAIWIETANDAAFLDGIGDTQWRGDQPLRTALATVTAVNGNQITLDRGLPFDFNTQGTVVREMDLNSGVALKNMTLKGDFGAADPADFTNSLGAAKGGMMLLVNTSDGVVISGINIVQPGSNGLVIAKSIDAEVTNVTVTGAHNKGDGGNGYAFWIRDVYDSHFNALQAFDTRHAVLFASVTSAAGNDVHVKATNRDINFHGGLDHDNTVIVDKSVRTGAEQGYLGTVHFVNPGTDYGAPTDPLANTVQFREVVGTVRSDLVYSTNAGSKISTLGGSDTLIGGNGNDRLDAGTGDDLIRASRGSDTVIGGNGQDTVDFDVLRSDVTISVSKGQLVVRGEFGVTRMSGVEYVTFDNGRYQVSDLMAQVSAKAQSADAFVFKALAVAAAEPVVMQTAESDQEHHGHAIVAEHEAGWFHTMYGTDHFDLL